MADSNPKARCRAAIHFDAGKGLDLPGFTGWLPRSKWSGSLASRPWRVSGRDSTDRNGLHELPRTAERHSETSNYDEGEISHKVSVMRMYNDAMAT